MNIDKEFEINKYHSERSGYKYGLYAQDTTYSFPCFWAVCVSNAKFVSGNSFYELLLGLFNKNKNENKTEFHDFVMAEFFSEERSLRFLEMVDNYSHRPFFNYYETWAKLVVKYLYEQGAIAPYRYMKFEMKTDQGMQFFFFRGNSRENILKSFKFHFGRTHHMKNRIKNNLDDWVFKFYRSCIDFNAMRADRFSFDREAFINKCPFITIAFQDEAFEKSNYYKRRELIV